MDPGQRRRRSEDRLDHRKQSCSRASIGRPLGEPLADAVWRLVEAAQALLDNLADADQHVDMEGNLLPDYEELADALGNVRVLLERCR